jgi:peptidyl-prolyl cis-trans isomerase C
MKMVATTRSRLLPLCFVALAVASGAPAAQARADDTVLVRNSLAQVTRADYEAELLKLPPEIRPGFANSARRVNDLLTRMLLQKSLAAQARAEKIDVEPENARRLQLEADRLLSQFMVERLEAQAVAEFDANLKTYEARARELYVADRAKYATREQLVVTHVLFDTKKRDSDAARKLALETRAKIAAGADMGQLARELSDDPSAQRNLGKIDWFARGQMDPAFSDAAFALKPGQLSEPVLSQFGWHVIRLDDRRAAATPPYEQVREAILADIRKRYVDEKRDAALAAIRRDPKTEVNRAAVEALLIRVDPEAARRALEMVPGNAPAAAAPAK